MNDENITISEKTRILEIVAVVCTAMGKFIFMDWLNWRFPYVAIAVIGWCSYIIFRKKQQPQLFCYWGFRLDNFKEALRLVLPFGIFSIIIFFLLGWWQGSIHLTWHILPILITYPLWGTIQQFLIIALVAGNLNDSKTLSWNKGLIILLTSILFSAVHYPSYWLMAGTFLLALFYGFVYLRVKNVYVLGLFHGWLGALFYYTVVGSDPFAEIFLKMF